MGEGYTLQLITNTGPYDRRPKAFVSASMCIYYRPVSQRMSVPNYMYVSQYRYVPNYMYVSQYMYVPNYMYVS